MFGRVVRAERGADGLRIRADVGGRPVRAALNVEPVSGRGSLGDGAKDDVDAVGHGGPAGHCDTGRWVGCCEEAAVYGVQGCEVGDVAEEEGGMRY